MGTSTIELDAVATAFQVLRPRLFGIAYRVTGSAGDAEDIVQDVWVKWQNCDRDDIDVPEAFLVRMTTRLAINVLNSARVRRETYVGPWLPEPVDTAAGPELTAERDESLSLAVLMLLESLSPAERAAFVLREAFGYEYGRIAEILGAAEPAVRKQVSRARLHLATGRRTRTTAAHQRQLLEAFLAAARSGDVAGLERVLTADVVSYSDGGGVVHAARTPLVGRERVVKFVAAISRWFWDGLDIRRTELNGEPALVFSRGGAVLAGFAVCAEHDGIDALYWLMNPEKLRAIAPEVTDDGLRLSLLARRHPRLDQPSREESMT